MPHPHYCKQCKERWTHVNYDCALDDDAPCPDHTCPMCGASPDSGEECDCEQQKHNSLGCEPGKPRHKMD